MEGRRTDGFLEAFQDTTPRKGIVRKAHESGRTTLQRCPVRHLIPQDIAALRKLCYAYDAALADRCKQVLADNVKRIMENTGSEEGLDIRTCKGTTQSETTDA